MTAQLSSTPASDIRWYSRPPLLQPHVSEGPLPRTLCPRCTTFLGGLVTIDPQTLRVLSCQNTIPYKLMGSCDPKVCSLYSCLPRGLVSRSSSKLPMRMDILSHTEGQAHRHVCDALYCHWTQWTHEQMHVVVWWTHSREALWHCGQSSACDTCIPHACQLMSKLIHFWPSSLLTVWEEPQKMAQILGPLPPCGRLAWSSWMLDLVWPSTGFCRHFWNEPVDKRSLPAYPSVTAFQVNTFFKKNPNEKVLWVHKIFSSLCLFLYVRKNCKKFIS